MLNGSVRFSHIFNALWERTDVYLIIFQIVGITLSLFQCACYLFSYNIRFWITGTIQLGKVSMSLLLIKLFVVDQFWVLIGWFACIFLLS